MIVLMALIAIVVSFAVVRYRAWINSTDINAEIKKLASLLQTLRMNAFTTKREFKIYLSNGGHTLVIDVWNGTGWKLYKTYTLRDKFKMSLPLKITDKGIFNATSNIIYNGTFNYNGNNCIVIDRISVEMRHCP